MKTYFTLRFITLLGIMSFYSITLHAQAFPTYHPMNYYDVRQGTKGSLFEINSNSVLPSEDNKAFIFSTNTNAGLRDLFRLTLNGVATFNSPFTDPLKIDLYMEGIWQGYIMGSGKGLNIVGNTRLDLGINNKLMQTFNATGIHFYDKIEISKSNIDLNFATNKTNTDAWIGTSSNHGLYFGTVSHSCLYMDVLQNTYIGLSSDEVHSIREDLKLKYKLFVKKGILTEDLAIGPQSSWSDFVFAPDYRLKPIEEVKQFVGANRHLPDVPSAQKIKDEGYSQHDMNKVLLQKIEELTLYMIQQNELIDKQNKRIQQLEAQFE